MIGVVIMEKQKFIVRCDRAGVFYGKPKGKDRPRFGQGRTYEVEENRK